MDNANIIPGDSENLFNLAVGVLGSDYPQLSLAQALDAFERLDLTRD